MEAHLVQVEASPSGEGSGFACRLFPRSGWMPKRSGWSPAGPSLIRSESSQPHVCLPGWNSSALGRPSSLPDGHPTNPSPWIAIRTAIQETRGCHTPAACQKEGATALRREAELLRRLDEGSRRTWVPTLVSLEVSRYPRVGLPIQIRRVIPIFDIPSAETHRTSPDDHLGRETLPVTSRVSRSKESIRLVGRPDIDRIGDDRPAIVKDARLRLCLSRNKQHCQS